MNSFYMNFCNILQEFHPDVDYVAKESSILHLFPSSSSPLIDPSKLNLSSNECTLQVPQTP